MSVTLNNRNLTPGIHFLVDPSCAKGNSTSEFQTLSLSDLYAGQIDFSKISRSKVFLWKNVNYGGDTIKKISQSLHKIAKFAPVVEVVNTKFTWSVSDKAYNFPFIQIQDSVFKDAKEISYSIDVKTMQHQARNVMGFLPAKKKSKQTIVITAHYDHLGRMGQATYFPGANDNASGNAMLLALAEKFKASPLKKYNILFIAFAGEEAGLLGSRYMVEHPVIPLKSIRFLLNLDIMGSGEEGITVVNSTLFPKEFDRLTALNEQSKFLTQIKKRGPAANSDHYFFTEAGVPALYIYTMGPNKNYHDVFDKYEALSFQAFGPLSDLLEQFFRGM
jgi:Iap family predicted aminopeptidase